MFLTAWTHCLFDLSGLRIDDFLEIPRSQRQPSLSQTLAAVALFTGNYVASGFMSSNQLGVGDGLEILDPGGTQWMTSNVVKC
eukprot:s1076_g7.t1